ncbi:MAG: tyrosine-type recombinase/integrase [Planctomycetota bacterium]|jgi:integrase
MKTYLPTYKDRKGKRKKCSHYYLTFVDNREIRRRLPAYTDKKETDSLGVMVDKLLDTNGRLDRDLKKWFAGLMPRVRNKLIEFGIVDGRGTVDHLTTPLSEHLRVFLESRRAKACKAEYIKQTESGILRVLNGCGFRLWDDIDGTAVENFLAKGRGPNGYSERTYNSYLRSFKIFTGWLCKERGLSPDPLDGQRLIKQTEYRKKRRPLSADEFRSLVEATANGKYRWNMTGPERALYYRFATETGARYTETRRLKVFSFNFDTNPCTVRIVAADSKNKEPVNLILNDGLAAELKLLLVGKEPTESVFNLPHKANAVQMLRADLRDAGVEYRDAAGRDVDIHAMKHTFVSNLFSKGISPNVIQKLARHSDIKTTMKYSHVSFESEVAAMQKLGVLTQSCLNGRLNSTLVDSDRQKRLNRGAKAVLSA